MHKVFTYFETFIKGKKMTSLIVSPLLLLLVFFLAFFFFIVYDKEKQKTVFLEYLRYSELLSSISLDVGVAQKSLDKYYKTGDAAALAAFNQANSRIRESSLFLKDRFGDTEFGLNARIQDNVCAFQEKALAEVDNDSDPARVFDRRLFIVKSFSLLAQYVNEFQSRYIEVKGKEYERLLDSQEQTARTLSLALLGIVVLLTAIIVTIFYSTLKQIKSVVGYANRLSGADWDVADLAMDSLREINVLSAAFNCMKKDIRENIALLKEKSDIEVKYLKKCKESADRKKRYAVVRHKLLVMQLDPHFLFNSLNLVYRQCMFAKQYPIMNTISDFAECLRYTIQTGDSFVTLKEELAVFNSYLRLLELRFGKDVQVEQYICVAENEILIIPFLIQPLFEHLLSCTPSTAGRKGIVRLLIGKAEGGALEIDARYTFELPALDRKRSKNKRFSPSAMENLRYRLRYFYKKSFSLDEYRDEKYASFHLALPQDEPGAGQSEAI